MPDIHLPYGGSTMTRTVNCPAWKRLSADIPDKPAGRAAAEGSCKHECMEAIVDGMATPESFLGQYFEEWDHTINDEDVIQMQSAIDAFNAICDEFDVDELEIEAFVQLKKDLIGGSADVIVSGDNNVLVIDWKFGHTPVSAERSWQGATYALSSMAEPEYADMFTYPTGAWKDVYCVIIQPKVSDEANVYLYDPVELEEMRHDIIEAVQLAESDEELTPTGGDHCLFCPAAPTCPAKIVSAKAALAVSAEMSMDLSFAMALASELEPWIKSVKEFAHTMLEQGADVEGWKLVDKRSPGRVWTDPEAVSEKLRLMRRLKLEDYANIKIKTPPQLEKECKIKGIKFEKEFGSMLHKAPSSGTTLAPESDKRPDARLITQADVTAALGKL